MIYFKSTFFNNLTR